MFFLIYIYKITIYPLSLNLRSTKFIMLLIKFNWVNVLINLILNIIQIRSWVARCFFNIIWFFFLEKSLLKVVLLGKAHPSKDENLKFRHSFIYLLCEDCVVGWL
jgi:hypothetical protein